VAGGAGGERRVDEVVPVALGHDRHEQLASSNQARVDRHPVELEIGPL